MSVKLVPSYEPRKTSAARPVFLPPTLRGGVRLHTHKVNKKRPRGATASAAPDIVFPWMPEPHVPPGQPAPPKDYAAVGASMAERSRFRGRKKVETPLAGESCPEPGGVLNQANFPEAAPRRWDDALFESRIQKLISPRDPKGGGGSSRAGGGGARPPTAASGSAASGSAARISARPAFSTPRATTAYARGRPASAGWR